LFGPLVSIVIVNYNGKIFLKKCLTSVLKTNYPNIEVIVVDNGSTDGSPELLRSFASDSEIKVILSETNLGFAGGNNVGIELATGDYVVFLNNDTTVEPNWINELVRVLESDFTIGAAQSKLLLMDSPSHLDCAGLFSNFYGDTFARGQGEKDVEKYGCGEIFTCKGASMIVRRKILERIGSFDSDYFTYYEDTDLSWRIRLAGYKILFVPSSIVYHKCNGSIPIVGARSLFFQVYLWKRNRIITLIKNYEIQNIIKYLFLSLVYEFSQIVSVGFSSLLKGGNLGYSIETSRALLWNLKHFSDTWKKRVYVQSFVRKVSDKEIMCKMRVKQ
jgi:GT2 family glycosyltransferase